MTRRQFLNTVFATAGEMGLAQVAHAHAPQTKPRRVADGVHVQDSIVIPAGETWAAESVALFVRADGRPPSVDIQPGATARNLWFVGVKETDPDTQAVCYLHDDATADNCAFAGYFGGFAVGTHVRGKLTNNLFVRCGTGDKSHPVYVSNWN